MKKMKYITPTNIDYLDMNKIISFELNNWQLLDLEQLNTKLSFTLLQRQKDEKGEYHFIPLDDAYLTLQDLGNFYLYEDVGVDVWVECKFDKIFDVTDVKIIIESYRYVGEAYEDIIQARKAGAFIETNQIDFEQLIGKNNHFLVPITGNYANNYVISKNWKIYVKYDKLQSFIDPYDFNLSDVKRTKTYTWDKLIEDIDKLYNDESKRKGKIEDNVINIPRNYILSVPIVSEVIDICPETDDATFKEGFIIEADGLAFIHVGDESLQPHQGGETKAFPCVAYNYRMPYNGGGGIDTDSTLIFRNIYFKNASINGLIYNWFFFAGMGTLKFINCTFEGFGYSIIHNNTKNSLIFDNCKFVDCNIDSNPLNTEGKITTRLVDSASDRFDYRPYDWEYKLHPGNFINNLQTFDDINYDDIIAGDKLYMNERYYTDIYTIDPEINYKLGNLGSVDTYADLILYASTVDDAKTYWNLKTEPIINDRATVFNDENHNDTLGQYIIKDIKVGNIKWGYAIQIHNPALPSISSVYTDTNEEFHANNCWAYTEKFVEDNLTDKNIIFQGRPAIIYKNLNFNANDRLHENDFHFLHLNAGHYIWKIQFNLSLRRRLSNKPDGHLLGTVDTYENLILNASTVDDAIDFWDLDISPDIGNIAYVEEDEKHEGVISFYSIISISEDLTPRKITWAYIAMNKTLTNFVFGNSSIYNEDDRTFYDPDYKINDSKYLYYDLKSHWPYITKLTANTSELVPYSHNEEEDWVDVSESIYSDIPLSRNYLKDYLNHFYTGFSVASEMEYRDFYLNLYIFELEEGNTYKVCGTVSKEEVEVCGTVIEMIDKFQYNIKIPFDGYKYYIPINGSIDNAAYNWNIYYGDGNLSYNLNGTSSLDGYIEHQYRDAGIYTITIFPNDIDEDNKPNIGWLDAFGYSGSITNLPHSTAYMVDEILTPYSPYAKSMNIYNDLSYAWFDCVNLRKVPQNLLNEYATLGNNGCSRIFKNCKLLERAPDLPALNLGEFTYYEAFRNTGINNVPYLLAIDLPNGVYEGMFQDCDNINDISDPFKFTRFDSRQSAKAIYRIFKLSNSRLTRVSSSPIFYNSKFGFKLWHNFTFVGGEKPDISSSMLLYNCALSDAEEGIAYDYIKGC